MLNRLADFLEKISKKLNEKVRVVMESSSVWYNIYSYLFEEKHLNVVLSNPVKTRAIASAEIKTDKLDAAKLANLLRGGYIAECYVRDRRIMDLRKLVRHRTALVRMRTKLKKKSCCSVSNTCTSKLLPPLPSIPLSPLQESRTSTLFFQIFSVALVSGQEHNLC